MTVKRYTVNWSNPMWSNMVESQNGDWVAWEDVEKLLKKIKELENRVQEVEAFRQDLVLRSL